MILNLMSRVRIFVHCRIWKQLYVSQWICLQLPSCGPGFESRTPVVFHNLLETTIWHWIVEVKRIGNKRKRPSLAQSIFNGHFFVDFCSFQTIYRIKISWLQRESNSYCRSRRLIRWPLDQCNSPKFTRMDGISGYGWILVIDGMWVRLLRA